MAFEYDVKGKEETASIKQDAVLKNTGRPLSFGKDTPRKKSSITLPVDTWLVVKEGLLKTCPEFKTQNELINAAILDYMERRKEDKV